MSITLPNLEDVPFIDWTEGSSPEIDITPAVEQEAHNAVEFYLLEGYLSACSILVISLNSLLLSLLLTKVRDSRENLKSYRFRRAYLL